MSPWPYKIICLGLLVVQPLQADWEVRQEPDPLSGKSVCLLSSETLATEDGYGEARVRLVLNQQALLAVADSHIDPSFADLTLVVDDNPPLPFDRLAGDDILVFERDREVIIERFRAGYNATLQLRFWPTWPATQRFPVTFSLIGFTRAHEQFQLCLGPERDGAQSAGS